MQASLILYRGRKRPEMIWPAVFKFQNAWEYQTGAEAAEDAMHYRCRGPWERSRPLQQHCAGRIAAERGYAPIVTSDCCIVSNRGGTGSQSSEIAM
jgi:hypothetical protein